MRSVAPDDDREATHARGLPLDVESAEPTNARTHDDGASARRGYGPPETSLGRRPVVFVVDDDTAALRSVELLLRRRGHVVRTFASQTSFLCTIDSETPGCVLLDLSPSGSGGLDVQKQLGATGRHQPIVFLSAHATVRSIVQAMKAGAEDFLEKPFAEAMLISSVERALERDRHERARRIQRDRYAARVDLLTPREREVLRHVIAGRTNKQIAARLGSAEKTVKVHRARVMHKMGVHSVAELTRVADSAGIQPEA